MSPADARFVLDFCRRLSASGVGSTRGGGQSELRDPAHPAIYFRNDSGAEVPAYACMEITGTAEVNSRTYFTIDQPSSDDGGPYLFNLHRTVASGGYGVGSAGPDIRAVGVSTSEAIGTRFNATASAWTIQAHPIGPFIKIGNDQVVASSTLRMVYRDDAQIALFQTPGGGIPAFASGTLGKATCTLYEFSVDGSGNASYASTSFTRTVHNMSVDPVGATEKIQAVLIDGLWIANYEDCGTA